MTPLTPAQMDNIKEFVGPCAFKLAEIRNQLWHTRAHMRSMENAMLFGRYFPVSPYTVIQ